MISCDFLIFLGSNLFVFVKALPQDTHRCHGGLGGNSGSLSGSCCFSETSPKMARNLRERNERKK